MSFMNTIHSNPPLYRRVSRKFIIASFSMALFASLCIILILCIQIRLYATELDRIKQTDGSRTEEIAQMRSRMADMELEIAELVKERLPSLTELAIDRVIEIDHRFLKNIVFTVTGKNGSKQFEYKTVLENTGTESIEPKAKVLFFDRLGIQIGLADIARDSSDSDRGPLEPGEVRSYHHSVHFPKSLSPRYFRVIIENEE